MKCFGLIMLVQARSEFIVSITLSARILTSNAVKACATKLDGVAEIRHSSGVIIGANFCFLAKNFFFNIKKKD